MPIGDIAGDALGGLFRFLGRLFVEIFFEFIIQGTGHVLLRIGRPRHEPSDTACAVAGLLFWAMVAVGAYGFYRATSS
ncbi:hypothetical protein OK348_02610 [Flavobacterium sp. MXW15]|uniref:Uncharacterized protein n=1 Tax=Xanthomonas chitinilytica TaxID=2989819 RepID=A0ABT3JRZ6_9XANT|nr:hypothetical protein [Xanthomonas sp. H13-6]MCW4453686.1 hypothetical protein [Flavobacterium sp. MXW15]MCW4471263.1 hypothetical protein [Xanthomonas sp. H13-6]